MLPVKKKKINIRKRWFYYLVLDYENKMAIHQRQGKDIWQDLYELPLIETAFQSDIKKILKEAEKKKLISHKEYELVKVSPEIRQQLSHQLIAGQFIKLLLKKKPVRDNKWLWVLKSKIGKYAFPQFINQYLREKKSGDSL